MSKYGLSQSVLRRDFHAFCLYFSMMMPEVSFDVFECNGGHYVSSFDV